MIILVQRTYLLEDLSMDGIAEAVQRKREGR